MDTARYAISLKTDSSVDELERAGLLRFWLDKREEFERRLRAAKIRAVILDFDGTVYDGGKLAPALPEPEMIEVLNRLASGGLRLGFASGRGLSLRDALREIFPPNLRRGIFAAYQDGADMASLDNDAFPVPYSPALEDPVLAEARKRLEKLFSAWPNPPAMRPENKMTGLRATPETSMRVFKCCCSICLPLGLKVFLSGKMIDITLPQVSKLNLIQFMNERLESAAALADAGAWPGNDFELLGYQLGVSVGTVSPDPDCCWRIGREEGTRAALEFLKRLQKAEEGVFRYV